MDPELLGWVKASEYRREILRTLAAEDLLTPSEIAERTDRHLSHVSGTLTDMEDRGVVECVTPERQKGRLYSITERGSDITEYV